MEDKKIIGVIGGMGPMAGVELVRQIISQTQSNQDQDHLPIVHISFPEQITDRTAFLLGDTNTNPAYGIVKAIMDAEKVGANVIGLACNTSHAPRIYDTIISLLKESNSRVTLVNMIDETIAYLQDNFNENQLVGVLSTNGMYLSNLYHNALRDNNIKVIIPDVEFQKTTIHRCIYDPVFGIKANADEITDKAHDLLNESILYFAEKGADAIILGCTELSFALNKGSVMGIKVIDPLVILGRSLIRLAAPERLKNLTKSLELI